MREERSVTGSKRRARSGRRLMQVLLESLMLASEMLDHVLQLDVVDLRLIQQNSELVLQLDQHPSQAVRFLSESTGSVKLAFHGADTDTDILEGIVARMPACRSACHGNNSRKSRVSDVSARILARMSVSVSASWNSSLIDNRVTLTFDP